MEVLNESLSQPIFSKEEIQENELKKAKLIELLNSGDAILLAGAGCSASIYPDWQGFVDLLRQEARRVQQDFNTTQDDFLAFADTVKDCIGVEKYHNVIFRCFKPKEKTHEKIHELLCQIFVAGKLRGITTTNYDTILEQAFASVTSRLIESVCIDSNTELAKVFEFFVSLNSGKVPKRILHLHGLYDQKDSIILSKSEYEKKYGFRLTTPTSELFEALQNGKLSESQLSELLADHGYIWTNHRKILWALFATRRLIFIGFSLNDPYFNKMLEAVSHDLHTYGYDNHFLILRIKDFAEKEKAMLKAEILKEKFGIETVFFEEDLNNEGLLKFIMEIHQKLGLTEDKKDPRHGITDSINDGDAELTEKLIKLSKQK